MVTISFKGSGVAAVDSSLLGFGQGLQVGTTKVNFLNGFVQLVDSQGRQISMGFFSSLHANDSKESNIKSFVFRAKTVCTVVIGKASYDYINLNEWVTYNYISEQAIEITRTATGQNPDVFDWQFFASDDPRFTFTIQPASRDSEQEILFAESSRIAATYTQLTNLRGAKKIVLQGQSPASAETGVASVTLEIYDPAKQQWNTIVPNSDIFTIAQGQKPVAMIGDSLGRAPTADNTFVLNEAAPVRFDPSSHWVGTGQNSPLTGFCTAIGYVLPSGDNVIRAKVVVTVAALTFSLSITKVFD